MRAPGYHRGHWLCMASPMEPPPMLIHRTMANGADRVMTGRSAREVRNHTGSIYLRLTPAARIVPVRGKCRLICCYCLPVPVRPLWHFLRCHLCQIQIEVRSTARMPRTSYGYPVLRRAIGYAVGRPLRVSGHASCRTVPVGGNQHEHAQWQARAAEPEQCRSHAPPAIHGLPR